MPLLIRMHSRHAWGGQPMAVHVMGDVFHADLYRGFSPNQQPVVMVVRLRNVLGNGGSLRRVVLFQRNTRLRDGQNMVDHLVSS